MINEIEIDKINVNAIKVNAIMATDKNGGIAKNGLMPWHNKTDLLFFKKKTIGNIVIMGSKTFESLNFKPLPNRINVVLTNNKDKYFNYNDSISKNKNNLFFLNYDEAIDFIKKNNNENNENNETNKTNKNNNNIFIIGGAQIIDLFLPYIKIFWLTILQDSYDCDTFLNLQKIDFAKWTEEIIYTDEKIIIHKHTIL